VIDLTPDISHARAVITHHEHLPAACLVEIAPFRLALLDVPIGKTLDFNKSGVLYP
jgi:hypothetical protein